MKQGEIVILDYNIFPERKVCSNENNQRGKGNRGIVKSVLKKVVVKYVGQER